LTVPPVVTRNERHRVEDEKTCVIWICYQEGGARQDSKEPQPRSLSSFKLSGFVSAKPTLKILQPLPVFFRQNGPLLP